MASELEKIDDSRLVATFMLDKAVFGIDAQQIQEVVRTGDITPVHHAPASVVGIRNLRGRIVTVIDLRARMELGCTSIGPENRILIVDWEGEPVGLLVDKIADTISVNSTDIQPPPPNMHGMQAKHLLGVCQSRERLVALLDPNGVLQSNEPTNQPSLAE